MLLKIKQNGFNWALYAFSFSLPFKPNWSSKALILLILVSVFNFSFQKKNLVSRYLKILVIVLIYSITNAMIMGSFNIESLTFPISLFLFYFLIAKNLNIDLDKIRNIALSFITGVLTVGLLNIVWFIFNRNSIHEFYGGMNHPTLIDIHKIYFAVYVNMAMVFLVSYFIPQQFSKKPLFYAALLLAYVLLIFSGSVSGIAINLMLVIFFIIHKKSPRIFNIVIKKAILLPILILFVLSIPIAQKTFTDIDGEGSRIRNYTINKSLVIKKPIFGYGVGNEFASMQSARKKNSWEYENNYNAHNQYFHMLIGGGALLLFGYVLLFNEVVQLSSIQFAVPLYFLFLVTYVCFIESFFERHHGVMFIAFFFSIFIRKLDIEKT